MDSGRKAAVLKDLREQLHRLERLESRRRTPLKPALPFGIPALDALWPDGGLPMAALHEAQGTTLAGFAVASAFAAAIAGRIGKPVLWCTTQAELYAPGLAQIGLPVSKLVIVRARSSTETLAVMEESLRHASLGCVIGETSRLDLTSSRRLQLAAESGGTMAFALRRPRTTTALESLAAASRWQLSAVPSTPHHIPQAGRARWKIELLRSRSGHTGSWIVEAPDAQGYLHLPSPLADGIEVAPAVTRRRAAG